MVLLEKIKEIDQQVMVIMITAFDTFESAVEAMKKGAYHYIAKPIKNDELKLVIENALERKRLEEENIYLKKRLKKRYQFDNIIGVSDGMVRVFELIEKVAELKSTILISGESGTGKELVASAIHYLSPRKDKPFVTINCGALPENLLESELFGHVKGAFTGAISNKEGLFEVADGGSLLLDEIGETTPALQVKLLRVLNDQTFKQVGGTKDISVDVRIIAASNKNLREKVDDGEFREDLYYRLNVIPIKLPPLRERKKDIALLVEHFLDKYAKASNIKRKTISKDAMEILANYFWPGNVRQLENTIERAIALESSDIIGLDSLPQELLSSPTSVIHIPQVTEGTINFEEVISNIEQQMLLDALRATNWNKTEAARLLKMSFRSFRYKLSKYDIKKDDSDEKN
jgi:two-component system response regulator PilR (NtrC family)